MFDHIDMMYIFTDINLTDDDDVDYAAKNSKILSYRLMYFSLDFNGRKRMLKIFVRRNRIDPKDIYILTALIVKFCDCCSTNIDTLTALIELELRVNEFNTEGETLITQLIKNNSKLSSIDYLKLLISAGADVNLHSNKGELPLVILPQHTTHLITYAKILIDAGANINLQNSNGETALSNAIISHCNIEYITFLIEAGADPNIGDADGVTPLITAARLSNLDYVKLLIKAGANVNARDINGFTALHGVATYCKSEDCLKCIKFLIKFGAKIDAIDNYGFNILLHCYSYSKGKFSNLECFKFLAGLIDVNKLNESGNTVLMEMCKSNHIEWVYSMPYIKILIDLGTDLDIQNLEGFTALILASFTNNFDCVKLLIESGANLNLSNEYNYTALTYACTNSNYKLMKLLVDLGTKFRLFDISTSLLNCNSDISFNFVKMLIKSTINSINVQDEYGNTLLIDAASLGNQYGVKFIKFLIKSGADINVQNIHKETALLSTINEDFKILLPNIEALIDLGANVNIQEIDGYTILMSLLEIENYWTMDNHSLLLKTIAMSDVTLKDTDGKTAYDYYLRNQSLHNLFTEYEIDLLRGKIKLGPKSARKICSS